VEGLVGAVVEPLGGVVTWAYTAAEPADTLRGWVANVSVQVDVKAHNRRAAYRRADAARRAVCGMPWQEYPDAVVVSVDVLTGPFWLTDQQGAPRYVTRFGLVVHPRPGVEEEENEI
jgi:hypothetical protein